jgi:hypothetical protein
LNASEPKNTPHSLNAQEFLKMHENNLVVDCEILSGDKMCKMPCAFCYAFFTTLSYRVIGVAHNWCAFLHAFGSAFIQRGAHVG